MLSSSGNLINKQKKNHQTHKKPAIADSAAYLTTSKYISFADCLRS